MVLWSERKRKINHKIVVHLRIRKWVVLTEEQNPFKTTTLEQSEGSARARGQTRLTIDKERILRAEMIKNGVNSLWTSAMHPNLPKFLRISVKSDSCRNPEKQFFSFAFLQEWRCCRPSKYLNKYFDWQRAFPTHSASTPKLIKFTLKIITAYLLIIFPLNAIPIC